MHGPVTLVGPEYPVLVFSPEDETRDGLRSLIALLREKKAAVFAAEEGPAEPGRPPLAHAAHPQAEPLPADLAFYRFAAELALLRGPALQRPRHLTADPSKHKNTGNHKK